MDGKVDTLLAHVSSMQHSINQLLDGKDRSQKTTPEQVVEWGGKAEGLSPLREPTPRLAEPPSPFRGCHFAGAVCLLCRRRATSSVVTGFGL